jgi:hypothetical protein
MAGIMNRTARQFNLKTVTKSGSRVVVRVAPGFNIVEDAHWESFVPKGGKVDPYVASLKRKGELEFGPKIDDLELEMDADTKAKSKSEPMSKLIEKAKVAEELAKSEKDSADKARAETEKALAEAEKAKLELKQLQDQIAESNKAKAKTTTK